MKSRQVIAIAVLYVFSIWHFTSEVVGDTPSRGRQILLDRGLQIQAVVFPSTGFDNISRWVSANFTTVNFWDQGTSLSLLSQMPASIQWARMYQGDLLSTVEKTYLGRFVGLQYWDEKDSTSANITDMKNQYATWRALYPDALAYTNFQGGEFSSTTSLHDSYMKVVLPDMLMFDQYPEFSFPTSGDGRNRWYTRMQRDRTAALMGNTSTDTRPIPYAQFLNLYRKNQSDPMPSESYVRLQQNASWAFGYTFVSAFAYNNYTTSGEGVYTTLFSAAGDDSPTPVFNYVKEANRQSQNLGPALVRLVNTGIFMKPASGQSVSGTGLTAWSSKVGATTGYADYLTSITPTLSKGGTSDTSYRDTLIGYSKPLFADNHDYPFADGLHFMIVNGSTGSPFSPGATGDPASNSAQWYRLTFDFTGSDFDALARLNRDTGQVELVPLTHLSGSQYALDLYLEGGTGDLFCFWDSSIPIPEPSALTLLTVGLGASVLLWICRGDQGEESRQHSCQEYASTAGRKRIEHS